MGRSKIEWLKNADGSQGYSINPIKGLCPMACKDDWGKEYCYARRMYRRFKWHTEIRFEPIRYSDLPKKPSCIFIGSTMELFGSWVDAFWLDSIFRSVKDNPQHTFIFLTKQPQNLAKWSPFPPNCWVGCSAPDQRQFNKVMHCLPYVSASVRFLSIEPMLSRILTTPGQLQRYIQWLILGSQTQPVRHPKLEWVGEIIAAADKAGVPVFVKEPLASHMGIHRQEFPKK